MLYFCTSCLLFKIINIYLFVGFSLARKVLLWVKVQLRKSMQGEKG